jgi:hypothetical protein
LPLLVFGPGMATDIAAATVPLLTFGILILALVRLKSARWNS